MDIIEQRRKREEFLITAFRLANGQAGRDLTTEAIAERMAMDMNTVGPIGQYLLEKRFIKYETFGQIQLTFDRIDEVEQMALKAYLRELEKDLHMSKGDALRNIFEHHTLVRDGTPLSVYKNWGKEDMVETEALAIREDNSFQFPASSDVAIGDVIQPKNASSFWKVRDIDAAYELQVIHHLDVSVVKIDKLGNEIKVNDGHAAFYGPVSGGVQVGGHDNTQTVTITTDPYFVGALNSLIGLIKTADIDDLEKEDALEGLQRIGQLAEKEKTSGVLERVKSKLELVKSAVEVGKIAKEALPYITTIAAYFGLS
ncbi:MAG: hypothetical protein WBD16_10670 [Pyrinomonadaceae bacterium]